MRTNPIWANILQILVALFFVVNGVTTFLRGNYVFSIIWLLVTGTMLVQSIRSLMQNVKHRKRDIEQMEVEEEVDIYGHRTAASYEKQRLQKLNDLYQSGCITKEEYEEKRKDIIEQI